MNWSWVIRSPVGEIAGVGQRALEWRRSPRLFSEPDVPIEFMAYVAEGLLSDRLAVDAPLHDVLETRDALRLESGGSVAVDDLLVVVAPPGTTIEVHWARHPLVLQVGPYQVTAELLTLPGFDPGKSLARPGGTFLPLGRARVSASAPGFEDLEHPHVWVNRFLVTRVEAEFELHTFFPGAEMVLAASEAGTEGRR